MVTITINGNAVEIPPTTISEGPEAVTTWVAEQTKAATPTTSTPKSQRATPAKEA